MSRIGKINALPAHALGRLQYASGAPKGVLREGAAPALWADADAINTRQSFQRRTMISVTEGIRLLVEEVYRTMPAPHDEDIIRKVFFAIEDNAEWLSRYRQLCQELTSDVVDRWGGRYVKDLTGLNSIREVDVERGHIIKNYTKLGR